MQWGNALDHRINSENCSTESMAIENALLQYRRLLDRINRNDALYDSDGFHGVGGGAVARASLSYNEKMEFANSSMNTLERVGITIAFLLTWRHGHGRAKMGGRSATSGR